jgi:pimeloyl-ACP methyl ester carboxylesterase
MRRLLRYLTVSLAALLVVIGLALMTFGYLALKRETLEPRQAAGPGAKYVRIDDLAIHYQEWGPADGKPLILMPGSFAWSETYRDIAVPLGQRGWRVFGVDMPPFGYSQRPADHDYSRAAQAGRLLDIADALQLDRFALGVHSYGGGAAIEAAFIAPERIEALILLDVALGLGKPGSAGPPLAPLLRIAPVRNLLTASTFTNPWMIGKGLRDFVHDDSLVTPERIEIYARPGVVAKTTEAVGLWMFTGLYANEHAAYSADLANYRTFQSPVLVIWGRDDSVTPLPQGEEIAAAFPKGRLEVLDAVNHIPQIEKPSQVIDMIDKFLREPRSAAAPSRELSIGALKGPIEP